jgi:hypothetical protein
LPCRAKAFFLPAGFSRFSSRHGDNVGVEGRQISQGVAMKAPLILLTCLVLTGFFSGCGGSHSAGSKEEQDAIVKKRMELKEEAEKKVKKK